MGHYSNELKEVSPKISGGKNSTSLLINKEDSFEEESVQEKNSMSQMVTRKKTGALPNMKFPIKKKILKTNHTKMMVCSVMKTM